MNSSAGVCNLSDYESDEGDPPRSDNIESKHNDYKKTLVLLY